LARALDEENGPGKEPERDGDFVSVVLLSRTGVADCAVCSCTERENIEISTDDAGSVSRARYCREHAVTGHLYSQLKPRLVSHKSAHVTTKAQNGLELILLMKNITLMRRLRNGGSFLCLLPASVMAFAEARLCYHIFAFSLNPTCVYLHMFNITKATTIELPANT